MAWRFEAALWSASKPLWRFEAASSLRSGVEASRDRAGVHEAELESARVAKGKLQLIGKGPSTIEGQAHVHL